MKISVYCQNILTLSAIETHRSVSILVFPWFLLNPKSSRFWHQRVNIFWSKSTFYAVGDHFSEKMDPFETPVSDILKPPIIPILTTQKPPLPYCLAQGLAVSSFDTNKMAKNTKFTKFHEK